MQGSGVPSPAQPEPPTVRLTFSELIAEGFDVCKPGRVSRKRVRTYVDMNTPDGMQFTDSAFARQYLREQKRRRSAIFDETRKEASTMRYRQLEKRVRGLGTYVANLHRKIHDENLRHVDGMGVETPYSEAERKRAASKIGLQRALLGIYQAELTRRTDIDREDAEIDLEIARVAGVVAPVAPVKCYDDGELIGPGGRSLEPPMMNYQPPRPVAPIAPVVPIGQRDPTYNPTPYHGPTDDDITTALKRGKSSLQILLEQRALSA